MGSDRTPSGNLLHQFRSDRRRLPLHPMERAVLATVAVHLCFLPWALGTMHIWSQLTSLGLATVGFVLALLPRTYAGDYALPIAGHPGAHAGPGHPPDFSAASAPGAAPDPRSQPTGRESAFRLTMWPRLSHFPIFWIGLALLAYIAIQGFNPSWVWERNATTWWLRRVNDIGWLPTSIDTPFERFNLWRQFIIYAAAWLTVCTVWVGFTRRRSLQILLTVIVANAIVLAFVGCVQHYSWPITLLGFYKFPEDAAPFSSFVNKNHAGAYLALLSMATAALATWHFDQGARGMKRSTPTGILGFMAAVLAGTVLFTLSRGASIALAVCSAAFFAWFFIRRKLMPDRGGNWVVTAVVVFMFVATIIGAAKELNFSKVARGFDKVIQQQTSEQSIRTRLLLYDAAKTMLAEHWQRGVGAGGFRYLFPEYIKHYPSAYQGGQVFWEHAHNDWLQIPIEQGFAGTLLLLLGSGYWFSFFSRRRVFWHSLAIPILLACSQTLIHAWFDFPLQCPAILLTWCSLIALAARWLELDTAS